MQPENQGTISSARELARQELERTKKRRLAPSDEIYQASSRWITREDYHKTQKIGVQQLKTQRPSDRPRQKKSSLPIQTRFVNQYPSQLEIIAPNLLPQGNYVPRKPNVLGRPLQKSKNQLRMKKEEAKSTPAPHSDSLVSYKEDQVQEALQTTQLSKTMPSDIKAHLSQHLQRKKPVQPVPQANVVDIKEEDVKTVEDAILYFMNEDNQSNVLHFRRHIDESKPYNPYDLRHVQGSEHRRLEDEQYLMTATSLVRSKQGQHGECIPINEWVHQSRMFDHLTQGIPIFHHFIVRKTFKLWNNNIKHKIFKSVRSRLGQQLLFTREAYSPCLQSIIAIGNSFQCHRPLQIPHRHTHASSLTHLASTQSLALAELENQLKIEYASIETYLEEAFVKLRQSMIPEDLVHEIYDVDVRTFHQVFTKFRSTPMNLSRRKKADIAYRQQQAERDMAMASTCRRLIHYIILESLYVMVIRSTEEFLAQVARKENLGSISVSASFVFNAAKEAGAIQLSPNEEQAHTFFDQSISQLMILADNISRYEVSENNANSQEQIVLPEFSLQKLFARDATLQATISDIQQTVAEYYRQCVHRTSSFEHLRPMYEFIHQEAPNLDYLLLQKNSRRDEINAIMKKSQQDLHLLGDWQTTLQKMHSSYQIAFIELQCRQAVVELCDSINTRRQQIYEVLNKLIVKAITLQSSWMKQSILVLDERPHTIDAFCEQAKKVREIRDHEKELHQDIRMIEDLHRLLKLDADRGVSDSYIHYNVHALYSKFIIADQSHLKFATKRIPSVSDQVNCTLRKYATQCSQLCELLHAPKYTSAAKQSINDRLRELDEIKHELDKLHEGISIYQSYQVMMGMASQDIVEYDIAQERFDKIKKLWDMYKKWQDQAFMLEQVNFRTHDWEHQHTNLEHFYAELREFNSKEFATVVGESLEEEIRNFFEQAGVLKAIGGSKYMLDRHWYAIYDILGMDKAKFASHRLTLRDLRNRKFMKFQGALLEIAAQAQREQHITQQLAAMRTRWSRTRLEMKRFEDSYELDEAFVEALLQQVDDDLVQIQLMLRKINVDSIYVEIGKWGEQINYIQEMLELWVTCQQNWTKLRHAFELADVRRNVRHASIEFQAINRKWKIMMNSVMSIGLILKVANEVTNCAFFSETNTCLERLWKELATYLLEKRSTFTRFNFISDQELLDVIACSQGITRASRVISTCFQNVISLETTDPLARKKAKRARPRRESTTSYVSFATTAVTSTSPSHDDNGTVASSYIPFEEIESENSDEEGIDEDDEDDPSGGGQSKARVEIRAIVGRRAENVVLQHTVKITHYPEEWMSVFERTLKATLRELVQAAVEQDEGVKELISRNSESIRDGNLFDRCPFPFQVLVLALRILWTQECHQIIQHSTSASSWSSLYASISTQIEHLNAGLQVTGTKEHSPEAEQSGERKNAIFFYTNLLICLMNQRNQVAKLQQANVDTPDQYLWTHMMRHYWNRESKRCILHHGPNTFAYGYDYLGASSHIVLTPLTDRVLLSMTLALRIHTGVMLYGATGCGKRTMLQELSYSAGTECIDFDCSSGVKILQFTRLLIGIMQCDLWVCVTGLEAVEKSTLALVLFQVQRLSAALHANLQTVEFEGTHVKLGTYLGLFSKTTLQNQDQDHERTLELLRPCFSVFLPVSCVSPECHGVIELYLSCFGFTNAFDHSQRIHSFFEMVHNAYRTYPGTALTMRTAKRLSMLAFRYRLGKVFDHENQMIAFAIWRVIGGRIAPKDTPAFMRMMRSVFPQFAANLDFGVATIRGRVLHATNKFGLENLPSLPHRVSELHRLYKTYHASIVVGDVGAGKSSIIRILASVIEQLHKAKTIKCYFVCSRAFQMGDFYGHYNDSECEWIQGLVPRYLHQFTSSVRSRKGLVASWLIFDGQMSYACVEPLCLISAESNTICLPNSEHLSLDRESRVFFESTDLASWSPSAVCRFGVLYLQTDSISYTVLIRSWLVKAKSNHPLKYELAVQCSGLLRTHATSLIESMKTEIGPSKRMNSSSLIGNMLEIMMLFIGKMNPNSSTRVSDCKLLFVFAATWSIGALLRGKARSAFNQKILEIIPELNQHRLFRSGRSVYDVYLGIENGIVSLSSWKMRLPNYSWKFNARALHPGCMFVPSEMTACYDYLISILAEARQNIMLVGMPGTGKTRVLHESLLHLAKLPSGQNTSASTKAAVVYGYSWINLDTRSTSRGLQIQLESCLERKMKGLYGPLGGKKQIFCLLDDLHLSSLVTGSTECEELVRQVVGMKCLYERNSYAYMEIADLTIACTCPATSLGQFPFSQRFLRHFHVLWKREEDLNELNTMFKHCAKAFARERDTYFQNKSGLQKQDISNIVDFMLLLYMNVKKTFLSSPSRPNYHFPFDCLSQLFRNLFLSSARNFRSKSSLQLLTVNLSIIVYRNRIIHKKEQEKFDLLFHDLAVSHNFAEYVLDYCLNPQKHIFGDCGEIDGEAGYQLLPLSFCTSQFRDIEDKTRSVGKAVSSNSTQQLSNIQDDTHRRRQSFYQVTEDVVHIVPFDDALRHGFNIRHALQQIHRGGHCILVGPYGSGRRTSAYVASTMLGYTFNDIRNDESWTSNLKHLLLNVIFHRRHSVVHVALANANDLNVADILTIIRNGSFDQSIFTKKELESIHLEMQRRDEERSSDSFELFQRELQTHFHFVVSIENLEILGHMIQWYPSLLQHCLIASYTKWDEPAFSALFHDFMDKWKAANFSPEEKKAIESIVIHLSKTMSQQSHHFMVSGNFQHLLITFRQYLTEKRLETTRKQNDFYEALDRLQQDKAHLIRRTTKQHNLQVFLKKATLKVEQSEGILHEETLALQDLRKAFIEDEKRCNTFREEIEYERRTMQQELDAALPELHHAIDLLSRCDKLHLTEMKSFTNPPELVRLVMEAVCVLLHVPPTWPEALKVLADIKFVDRLQSFDKDKVTSTDLAMLQKYFDNRNFTKDALKRVSIAATSIYTWVCSIRKYHIAKSNVAPKQERLDRAVQSLMKIEARLSHSWGKLQDFERNVECLRAQHGDNLKSKAAVQAECEAASNQRAQMSTISKGIDILQKKIQRKINKLHENTPQHLAYSLFMAAVYVYLGPCAPDVRLNLVQDWQQKFAQLNMPILPFAELLRKWTSRLLLEEWTMAGLLNDQNVLYSAWLVHEVRERVFAERKYPLILDPQAIATSWLRQYGGSSLQIIQATDASLLETVRTALSSHSCVLIENISPRKCDCLIDIINIAEEVGPEAFVYFTCRMDLREHLCYKVMEALRQIDFSSTRDGMVAQLLQIYIHEVQPQLETRTRELNLKIVQDLRLLKETFASLIDGFTVRTTSLLDLEEEEIVKVIDEQTKMAEAREKLTDLIQQRGNQFVLKSRFMRIALRGVAFFDIALNLHHFNPAFTFTRHRLLRLWRLCLKQYIQSHHYWDTVRRRASVLDPNRETIELSILFLEELCSGLPMVLHPVVNFSMAIAAARSDHRISDDVAAICLNLIHTKRSTEWQTNIALPYQYWAAPVVHQVAVEFVEDLSKFCIRRHKFRHNSMNLSMILSGSYRLSHAIDGKRRPPTFAPLLKRVHPILHLSKFNTLPENMDKHEPEWKLFTMKSKHERLKDFPHHWKENFTSFEKFLFLAYANGQPTMQLIADVIALEFQDRDPKEHHVDLKKLTKVVESNVPILILIPPSIAPSCVVESITEFARASGVTDIRHISMVDTTIVSVLLRDTLASTNAVNCWYIIQDVSVGAEAQINDLQDILESISATQIAADIRLYLLARVVSHPAMDYTTFALCKPIFYQPPTNLEGYLLYSNRTQTELSKTPAYKQANAAGLFWQAIVCARKKYDAEGSGWSLPYEVGLLEYRRIESILTSVVESCSDPEQCVHLFMEMCLCLYAGRISEPTDIANIYAILRASISSDEGTNFGYVRVLRQGLQSLRRTLAFPNKRKLRTLIGTEQLGLPSKSAEIHECANYYSFAMMLQQLNYPAQFRSEDGLAHSVEIGSMLQSLQTRLPSRNCFRHDARRLIHVREIYKTTMDEESLYNGVLLQELAQMEQYLGIVWETLDQLETMRFESKFTVTFQALVIALMKNQLPDQWQQSGHSIPLNLEEWLVWILSSVSFLQHWIQVGKPAYFWAPALQNLGALIFASKQAVAKHLNVLVCVLEVKTAPEDSSDPNILCLTGMRIRNASWLEEDGSINELQDTDENLLQQIPLLKLIPFLPSNTFEASKRLLSCPIYKQLCWRNNHGRKHSIQKNYVGAVFVSTITSPEVLAAKGIIMICNPTYSDRYSTTLPWQEKLNWSRK